MTNTITQPTQGGPLATPIGLSPNPGFPAGYNGAIGTRKLRYIHIGDSEVLGDSDARNNFWASRDLPFNVAICSGGYLLPARNAGVGGQTSPQIAQRVIRDVMLLNPDVVGITVGINDGGTLLTADYIEDAFEQIATCLNSMGVFWFITSTPPNNPYNKATMQAINRNLKLASARAGVPFVDLVTPLQDPSRPGNFFPNWDQDGIHWTSRTCQRAGYIIWDVIQPYINYKFGAYVPKAVDVANQLLFPTTANTGLPSATNVTDSLFLNSRGFSQNGFTTQCPYMFATQSGTAALNPAISGTTGPMAGVTGNAFTVTLTPNGNTGSYTVQTSASGRQIPIERFQGQRIRIEWLMACSGFMVDNTDAYLAANASTPKTGVGFTITCLNSANTNISNSNFPDPTDVGSSLGQASTIPCEYQSIIMGRASAGQNGWCNDFPLTPVAIELNVPAGAVSLQFSMLLQVHDATAAAPVTVSIAQFSVRHVGPAFIPQVPSVGFDEGHLEISTSATITTAQARAIPYYRCTDTAGAIAPVLPASASCRGRRLTFTKVAGANTTTITAAGADTIGSAAGTTKVLTAVDDSFTLYCRQGGWDVVAVVP